MVVPKERKHGKQLSGSLDIYPMFLWTTASAYRLPWELDYQHRRCCESRTLFRGFAFRGPA